MTIRPARAQARSRLRPVVIAAIALLTGLGSAAAGADRFWTSLTGGNFHDATNWDTAVPAEADTAIFDVLAIYAVSPFVGASNQRVVVRRGEVTFALDPGATYALMATSPLTPGMVVGELAGDIASLTVLDGRITPRYAYLGQDAGAYGVLTLDAGAALSVGDQLHVGKGGEGLLEVTGNAQLTSDRASVGLSPSGAGFATISGAGTAWAAGPLTIGQHGMGVVTVADGATLTSDAAIIGQNEGSLGDVVITGTGSTWTVGGPLDVGQRGTGSLLVENGGRVDVNGFLSIGSFPGGEGDLGGNVTISGIGSTITTTGGFLAGDLHVGFFGTGRLVIEHGATLSVANDIMSTSSGLEPQIHLHLGAASDWQDEPALAIGRSYTVPDNRMGLVLAEGFRPRIGDRFRLATARDGLGPGRLITPNTPTDIAWAIPRVATRLDVVVVPAACVDDGTGSDCNSNGIDDDCDVDFGASRDCNGNGVPDECDLADGVTEDCNGNGIPDVCDIADGTASDCDGNGIPDACDLPLATIEPDGGAGAAEKFGDALDADAGTAVIGAPRAAGGGAVNVYEHDGNTWVHMQTLTAPDGRAGDDFGTGVALSGDLLVVGAPGVVNEGSASLGAAYVFRRTEGVFTLEDTLSAGAGQADRVGEHVAADGDDILVGAQPIAADAIVSAYFFRHTAGAWAEVRRVTVPAASLPIVGATVAVSAGRAAVGAPRTVRTYRTDDHGWTDDLTLQLPLLAAFGSNLGVGVAIAGDMLVALGDDNRGDRVAYVYRDDGVTWQEDVAIPVVAAARDVDTDGTRIVARGTTAEIYVDDGAGWQRLAQFAAGPFSLFGFGATAIDGDVVLAGRGNQGLVRTLDLGRLGACLCPADVDGNGLVDFQDLLAVLTAWGPCPGCPEDIDANREVDFQDLLILLFEWGPCE